MKQKKAHKIIRKIKYFDGDQTSEIEIESLCYCPKDQDHLQTKVDNLQNMKI